jgi:hypothetical protein
VSAAILADGEAAPLTATGSVKTVLLAAIGIMLAVASTACNFAALHQPSYSCRYGVQPPSTHIRGDCGTTGLPTDMTCISDYPAQNASNIRDKEFYSVDNVSRPPTLANGCTHVHIKRLCRTSGISGASEP